MSKLDTQILPGEPRRILLGQHLHRVAVDHQPILVGLHVAGEASVHRVVFEQVGQRLRIR